MFHDHLKGLRVFLLKYIVFKLKKKIRQATQHFQYSDHLGVFVTP